MSPDVAMVLDAFVKAGEELKSDLWRPDDVAFLRQRAQDLVGLNLKASLATEQLRRVQYQAAAMAVVDHVKLLALVRMQVAQDHVVGALERFFLKTLLPMLGGVLGALF